MSSTPTVTSVASWPHQGSALQNEDWYALQTRARFERTICGRIQGKGQEAYVPVARERRRWSDRQQTIEVPMFPGYVFVRAVLGSDDRLAVLQTGGVYGFVTFNGIVARIPDPQISDLRRVEEHSAACSPHPYLAAGQRVRVCGGCLDGLEGIFVAEQGRKLVISLGPMQRSIALDVSAYELEMLEGVR